MFQRYGSDIVVKWDADDDALDVWLQAALMVATALSVKAASHDKQDAASFDKIDKAIERIRKCIEGFEEINTSATTAKSAAEKILNRARLIQEGSVIARAGDRGRGREGEGGLGKGLSNLILQVHAVAVAKRQIDRLLSCPGRNDCIGSP